MLASTASPSVASSQSQEDIDSLLEEVAILQVHKLCVFFHVS
jgi:hypothetical protein